MKKILIVEDVESNCDDYLTKPLDEALLFDKLEHFLGR